MKIASLSARNFTGCNFDIAFGDVTIITGGNFAGKSAIPTLVRLLLTGSLPPPIGVKGIYRYAGNPEAAGEMSGTLTFDNGRTSTMKWNRSSQGKMSTTGSVPTDLIMPLMLANPRSFWAKTGAERVQFIFEACPGAGKDLAKTIGNRLGEIQVMPLKALLPILAEIQGYIQKVFNDGTPPQQQTAKLIDWLSSEAKEAASSAKFQAGALAAIGPLANLPPDRSAELEEIRQALALLQVGGDADRGKLRDELAATVATLDAYSRKYKQTPPEKLAEFINHEAHTVICDMRNLAPAPPLGDLQEEVQEAETIQVEAETHKAALSIAVQTRRQQIADLNIAEQCPVCLAKVEGWKVKAIKSLSRTLAKSETELAAATATAESAKANALRLKRAYEEITTATAYRDERSKELHEESATLETDRDAVLVLMAHRISLTAQLSSENSADEQEQVKLLQEKADRLQTSQNERLAAQNNMTRREQLETDYAAASVRAQVMKEAVAITVEEQKKAGEQAFGTVLKTARFFTDGLLNSPLEFIDGDLGRRVSALDRARPGCVADLGSWVTHEVFSDSEQRIAYVAFAVALAAEAPIKLVILDEMATIDKSRKVQFVDRLLQLTRKGIIDQAICLEPSNKDYLGFADEPGIKLIQL